jgi:hypothetical protein
MELHLMKVFHAEKQSSDETQAFEVFVQGENVLKSVLCSIFEGKGVKKPEICNDLLDG